MPLRALLMRLFLIVALLANGPGIAGASMHMEHVRDSAGDVHALDDTCSHAAVSLSEGEVEDCSIECWLHGSRFDLLTGRPSHLPATVPVAVHTVRVTDDGDVLVALAG